MPVFTITTLSDLDLLHKEWTADAHRATRALRDILSSEDDPLQVLRLLKFAGTTVVRSDALSVAPMEHIDGVLACLARLEAARCALEGLALPAPFKLNTAVQALCHLQGEVGTPWGARVVMGLTTESGRAQWLASEAQCLIDATPTATRRYLFVGHPTCKAAQTLSLPGLDKVELWSLPLGPVLAARA